MKDGVTLVKGWGCGGEIGGGGEEVDEIRFVSLTQCLDRRHDLSSISNSASRERYSNRTGPEPICRARSSSSRPVVAAAGLVADLSGDGTEGFLRVDYSQ